MKTTAFSFLLCFFPISLLAQVPLKMSYQAVVRDAAGNLVKDHTVGIKVSILHRTETGTLVFSETYNPARVTNGNGLVTLEIGSGTPVTGSFTGINWANGPYFLKTETDPSGGSNYTITATVQLLSVPYAMHARSVESVTTDATLSGQGSVASPLKLAPQGATTGQVLKWNGSAWLPSNDLSGGGSSPGGSNGHLQFNNNGVLGGDAGLIWDNTGKSLGIGTGSPAYPLHLTTSGNMGIFSESSAVDGRGIFGYASSPTGYNFGLKGESASVSGTGVWGISVATEGTTVGVKGMVSSPEGYAGYFTGGKFRVESQAAINNTLSMEYHKISNVSDPVNLQDAATKAYVDALITQLSKVLAIVADADGNIYPTVRIGSQVWMAENLKTTKYNDGTEIVNVPDNYWWGLLERALYCWYNNDINNKDIYGALYNWYAVNTGKLCPAGWHVPTDAEWTTLTTFLGGLDVAGGKMKSKTGWEAPNTGATNESGFSALSGGVREENGTFRLIPTDGYWWSSSDNTATYTWGRMMSYFTTNVSRANFFKLCGFSVRCLRNF